ncbi:MAG: cell surface protein [Acidovorax sp.]|nr:cell surface protein [Acidovorax sp.]
MRKNLLALSIAAMIGGVSGMANAAVFKSDAAVLAGAVADATKDLALAANTATALNPTVSGVGHILTIPYFSTQGGNATLLNITNTDVVNGKAVKLRFRGAANSDDIFDITIFLSPGDVWSAAVSASGELSALSTSDTSCTLPSIADIKAQGGLFKTGRVNPTNSNAETREGYVEILNTADIPTGSALFTAIKHVAGKAPCTASVMDAQSADLKAGDAANNPRTRGYSWPTGGLYANWILVNTTDKASFSGEAVAVRAETAAGLNGSGNLVSFPQTTDAPDYATSVEAAPNQVRGFTADPLLQSAGFAGQVANYDFPDLSTPYTSGLTINAAGTAAQATALANALATKSVVNDYLVGGGASFTTDWVFSMPTRRYAAAVDYAAKTVLFNAAVNTHFSSANTSLNTATLQACVTPGGALKGYSREEDTQSTFVISPDTALKLCGETSVLTFGSEKVLKAAIASRIVPVNYAEGWLTVGTTGLGNGLPVIGYAATKAAGATNLGGTWTHRTAK